MARADNKEDVSADKNTKGNKVEIVVNTRPSSRKKHFTTRKEEEDRTTQSYEQSGNNDQINSDMNSNLASLSRIVCEVSIFISLFVINVL